jgi:hypothetical protein
MNTLTGNVRLLVGTLTFMMLCTLATPLSAQMFKCGNGLLTYEVQTIGPLPPLGDTSAVQVEVEGIRCLRVYTASPGVSVKFIWYGEGHHGQRNYHHVGYAVDNGIGISGTSADIPVAPSDFDSARTTSLFFKAVGSPGWPAPNNISVTGTWKENWALRPDGVNYTPLPRPSSCGSYFTQYTPQSSTATGTGIRCILTLSTDSIQLPANIPYVSVWYGTGQWNGRPYTHVGRIGINRQVKDQMAGTGEASDLCDPRLGQACNSTADNSITFTEKDCFTGPADGVGGPTEIHFYLVGGAWNERWYVPLPLKCLEEAP